jgi:general secretion pathway protein K
MMKPVRRLAYPSHSVQQRGFALLLVLWILSLLTIMAGSFALTIRRESAIVAGLKDNAQAAAVAESGLAIAQVMLLNNDKTKRWVANGSIYSLNDWQQLGV